MAWAVPAARDALTMIAPVCSGTVTNPGLTRRAQADELKGASGTAMSRVADAPSPFLRRCVSRNCRDVCSQRAPHLR